MSEKDLIERIKEELCKEGICFREEDELEIIAKSYEEYLEYVRNYLNDVCPCLREAVGVCFDDVVEAVADAMLGDTVYYVKVNGEEYYVKLA